MNYTSKAIVFFVFFVSFFSTVSASEFVSLSAVPSKNIIKKGEVFEVRVTMNFKGQWYSYGMEEVIGPDGLGPLPTFFLAEPSDLVEIKGNVREPKPGKKYDKAFEIEIFYHSGKPVFVVPLLAKKDIDISKSNIKVIANMQLCDAERCLPPEDYIAIVRENKSLANEQIPAEQPIDVTLSEEEIGEVVEATDEITNVEAAEIIEKDIADASEEKQGIFSFLWFSMTAGALALLTPCVFPMVPITVSFFTRRAEKNKGKGLRDALVYVFGIIFTFTGLGFLFSVLFGASGIQDFTASPWVNLVISLIFIMFAFNLFGAFEIQIPSRITNKLNAKSMEGEGIMSVILMGLTFSLASFSCTGPLVAAALVSAASGDWFYPIISMLGFSTVLAAPFFLLALFPTALSSMPKAGGWMNNIKVVLGFVVIAATMKFLNNAFYDWGFGLTREIFLSIWIACTALATIYILGGFRMAHDTPLEKVGSMRILFALFFATATFYLISGFSGKPMGTLEAFLPAPEQTAMVVAGVAAEQEIWYDNVEEALAVAKRENKPIFLDFTGKHCPNCRLMERNVFPKPEIAQRLSQMVKIKLITDVRQEPYISNKKYQLENFKSVAIPFYVVMNPSGEVLSSVGYTPNIEKFGEFLDIGLKR